MITELGERYVKHMTDCLERFSAGDLSLGGLLAEVDSVLGLLHDEADPEWVGEMEAERNRLENVYAASINEQRVLSPQEATEVSDGVQQLQLMLTRY